MPGADVLPDLVPQVEPAREHRWEGVFDLTADDDHFSFNVIAQLTFQGALIEGAGNATLVDAASLETMPFTLSGERTADAVAFRFWFAQALMPHPFEGAGTLDAEERVMDGHWTYQCIDPEGCGCAGGQGSFRLERVDE